MISRAYVIPNYNCNLDCPHCEIHKRYSPRQDYNKIIDAVREVKAKENIVFGGEPSLNIFMFESLITSGDITSVSTNLVAHPPAMWRRWGDILKRHEVSVATSWNYKRFTDTQYHKWLANLSELNIADVDTMVLITLTPDLIASGHSKVLNVLNDIEITGCTKFLFEPFIGDTSADFHCEVDEWLCLFHDAYFGKMTNVLEERLDNWKCNCDDVVTIHPDGTIIRGCPDSLSVERGLVPNDCLLCDNTDKCRPCKLQKYCSYPKALARKLGVIC